MKLQIENKETYNCLQNFIASAAGYYQRDYRMMMLELWGFLYQEQGKNIGERLDLVWNGKLDERKRILKKYHGLVLEYVNGKELHDLQKTVEQWPTAFYIDSYECEWLPFYRKQHRGHICNIVHIKNDIFFIQDEFCCGDRMIRLPDSQVFQKCGKFIIVKEESYCERVISVDLLKEAFREAFQKYLNYGMREQFVHFVCDIKNNFKLGKEIPENTDPVASRLIMYLKCLGDDRFNLTEAFVFYNLYESIDLEEIKSCLKELSNGYYLLRNYIIKCNFLGREPEKTILNEKLDGIYRLEDRVFQYILELSGKNTVNRK